jgi:cytochrome c553
LNDRASGTPTETEMENVIAEMSEEEIEALIRECGVDV